MLEDYMEVGLGEDGRVWLGNAVPERNKMDRNAMCLEPEQARVVARALIQYANEGDAIRAQLDRRADQLSAMEEDRLMDQNHEGSC